MVPAGTTSRQLLGVARWALAGVLGAGALVWWWPSAAAWGAMSGGVVLVLLLWLMVKTSRADRTAPAGLFHLALAGPAMVLSWHFLRHGLLPHPEASRGDWGTLDLSAIYQFALMALVGMLSQELFASLRARGVPTFLAGAGMVIGALAAALWGKAAPAQPPMTLLAFSGVGLWVAILYSGGYRPPKAAGPGLPPPRAMHRAAVASCVVLCGALWFLFPAQGVLAAALLGGAAWLGAICLGGPRLRAAAIALAALALAVACLVAGTERVAHSISRLGETLGGGAALGIGEEAYAGPWESNLGPRLVALQIGWAGLAWLGAGLLAAGVLALRRAKATGEGAATVLRLWSAALAMAALFSSLGLFVPAVSLAVGFTWGCLQAPGARPGHPWSGWVFLALLTALMFLLALAPAVGLLEWACDAYGMRDDFLHVVCGMLFTAILVWQLGSRRIWKGLVGAGFAVAAGGGGELAQYLLTSTRNAEWGDFFLHSAGCAVGAVLYLLSIGARLCEAPIDPATSSPASYQ